MRLDIRLVFIAATIWLAAAAPASAQPVYRCGSAAVPTYSDRPCSRRVVNTEDAPVRPRATPEWTDQRRTLARSLHRMRGETPQQFAVRKRRALLPAADRAECARLDTRIALEAARRRSADAQEAAGGAAGLRQARRRFARVGC